MKGSKINYLFNNQSKFLKFFKAVFYNFKFYKNKPFVSYFLYYLERTSYLHILFSILSSRHI